MGRLLQQYDEPTNLNMTPEQIRDTGRKSAVWSQAKPLKLKLKNHLISSAFELLIVLFHKVKTLLFSRFLSTVVLHVAVKLFKLSLCVQNSTPVSI